MSRPTSTPDWNRTPSRSHLLQAAVDDPLFELEVRNAVAEQAADAVVLLEEHRLVTGAIDLLRGRQAGRARNQ